IACSHPSIHYIFSYLYLHIRDGPDQTSPQIGQFSGTSVQEGVSSTANHVLIKFHSDFSTSGFFELHYYAYQLRTCQPPPPVANATFLTNDDEFEIGDIIRYSCQPGFTLVGSEILTCRLGERLQMDGSPPVCQDRQPAGRPPALSWWQTASLLFIKIRICRFFGTKYHNLTQSGHSSSV
ncbi:CUB and sushi domain-containing protein 3, partial [Ataeniobius toweri]|nr:CUB and sushi domain-containing protein 3 [Ataeniobius toweri]